MQQQTTRPRFRPGSGCVIALIALLLMGSMSVGGYFWARGYFLGQYYQELYAPVGIDGNLYEAGQSAPTPVPVDGYPKVVPLLVAEDSSYNVVSYALCAQMLAAQRDVETSRQEIEFLAATTYGASSKDGGVSWVPFSDPELGLAPAAQCLGLERIYEVGDDADIYLMHLGAVLAEGTAVRVAVDRAVILGKDSAPDPQAIVIVCHDGASFTYHDPLAGAAPQRMDAETLLDSQRSLAKAMRTPWEFSMTTLAPNETTFCDMAAIWRRNGQSLIGGDEDGALRGAAVVDRAAKVLERKGIQVDQAALAESLAMTAYARAENASYLRATWPSEPEALAAVEHLLHAVALYGRCQASLEDGLADDNEARALALLLRQAAQAERQAGEAMIDMARQ